MRRCHVLVGAMVLLLTSALVHAAGKDAIDPQALDRQLYETLRDVHNRGADLYNGNEPAACYRMFQGALQVARAALAHRPAEQKLIADGLAGAERETSISKRAFMLHELIEQVRSNIRPESRKADVLPKLGKPDVIPKPKKPAEYEPLKVVPRELAPKASKPTKGVAGRVLLAGKPLGKVEMAFVSRGQLELRVFETTTLDDGTYRLEDVKAGRYTVLLTLRKEGGISLLPERYATTTTSPLIAEVKPGGDTLDFLLQ